MQFNIYKNLCYHCSLFQTATGLAVWCGVKVEARGSANYLKLEKGNCYEN